MKTVICQICAERIGSFDAKDLTIPLRGAMFGSSDILHGFPPPFDPEAEWEDFRCPYCRTRPFIERDEVLTEDGTYKIAEPKEEATTGLFCSECGKEFGHPLALNSHMRMHRRREEHGDR